MALFRYCSLGDDTAMAGYMLGFATHFKFIISSVVPDAFAVHIIGRQ